MKLTLRKANAVQASINEALKAINIETNVTLNEFEDVAEQINVVVDRFFANTKTRDALVTALYEIRAKVARANADAGINDMLANVAYSEKVIGYNNVLVSAGAQTSMRVLNGQVKKNAEAKDEGYGYSRRDVSTSIFTEAQVEGFKRTVADYKRTKRKLQDELLALNIQTEIELSEETALLLTKENIL